MTGDGDEDRRREEARDHRNAMSGLAAGYMLLGSVGMGLLIGYGLDRFLVTTPRWTAIMAGVFIVAGLYQVVKTHWPRS